MKYMIRKTLVVAFLFCASNNIFSQLSPLVIGKINAGDSVVIYYDVTINAGAGLQVTNQGTVSGSNFASLVTDVPDTGPADDPTITLLNSSPLPVTFYELKAAPKNAGIMVTWNVSYESNMIKYEVERSINGRTFNKIGEVASRNLTSASTYSFFDPNPNNGVNYYRLKLLDQASGAKHSNIVRVSLGRMDPSIAIYPNPVKEKIITLQLTNMAMGNYELALYNTAGQLAYSKQITHDGGSLSKNITLPANLAKGIYSVQLKDQQTLYNRLLIIQ